jgi:hypothetical protein
MLESVICWRVLYAGVLYRETSEETICCYMLMRCYMLESVLVCFAAGDQCWCVLLVLYAYEMLYAGECAGVFCCWRSVLVCFACVICL